MVQVQHRNITNSELHEPKDVNTATLNQVYRADGSASGDWKKIYLQGQEDFCDVNTQTNVISLPTQYAWYPLTNDGAGEKSNSLYRLPGTTPIWNTSTNRFDWTSLKLGDTVDLRLDLTVNNHALAGVFRFLIEMAFGHADLYQQNFGFTHVRDTGQTGLSVHTTVCISTNNIKNNPARLLVQSDGGSATDWVKVNGFYTRVIPLNPVFN